MKVLKLQRGLKVNKLFAQIYGFPDLPHTDPNYNPSIHPYICPNPAPHPSV